MNPERLSESERRLRGRAVLHTALYIALAWVVLVAVYYLQPIGTELGGAVFLRVAAGVILFAAVVVIQIKRVLRADLPGLRAVQALGLVIPLFFVIFAAIYLSMASVSQSAFSQPLNHTKSLYFTISVFSTVGFGDITPRTDPARLVVAVQMLLNLVVFGVVVRLLVWAARTSHARHPQKSSDQS